MTDREAVLGFHYAERAKALLIQAHRLMEAAASLSHEEAAGAAKVVGIGLQGVRGELLGARHLAPHIQWDRALLWVGRILERWETGDLQGALEALSHGLSAITTMSQRSMERLLERKIL